MSILEVDEDAFCVFLRGDYSWLYDKASGETLENELGEHIESAGKVKSNIAVLLDAFHEALALIHYTGDDTFENIRMVAKVLALIVEAPYMEAAWFDLRKNAEMVPLIVQAREHSNIIERITSELLETWELSALEIDADGMLSRFKTEYVGLFHKMKANYKEDIKTLRLHAKAVGAKLEEPDIINFLQKVREINNEKAWFSQNREALEQALGHHFHGEKTDWDRVRASMAAALQITDQFPYDSISQDTIEALRKITESLQLSGNARRLMEVLCEGTIDSLAQSLSQCKCISSDVESQNLTKDIIPEIDAFVEVCTQHMEAGVEHFGRGTDNSVDGILMIVDPSFESLRLSAKIADLSTSIGKPIWFCLNKVTEETAQMMEEEVGKHGAIIGRMPLDHDLGLAGLTGTELQMTIAPISEMAQFLIQ